MRIDVRPATPTDTRQMAELLNEIINAGGTTALTRPVDAQDLIDWMQAHPGKNAWFVAESETGEILGFQFFEPNASLPPEAVDIATFVRIGVTQLGIGSKLFSATEAAARTMGYAWINANIRADNSGGLTYYQSRGFRTYRSVQNVPLDNGMTVEKLHKRYDLD